MRVLRLLTVVSCFLALSACVAPMTKDQLRQHASNKVDFEVNRPYQQVFSDLLGQTRLCYLNKEQKRQITVVGNRDNSLKTANIIVEEVYAMAGHDAYLVIDLMSKNENLTQVSAYVASTYFSNNSARNEMMSVKAWALQENNKCDVQWLL